TKIARRSVWMAVGASARSATVCMAVSRVGGFSNLTLPEHRSLSRHPWDLEARARRHLGRQHPILDRNAAQLLATTATALACAGRRLRLARPVHSAARSPRAAPHSLPSDPPPCRAPRSAGVATRQYQSYQDLLAARSWTPQNR